MLSAQIHCPVYPHMFLLKRFFHFGISTALLILFTGALLACDAGNRKTLMALDILPPPVQEKAKEEPVIIDLIQRETAPAAETKRKAHPSLLKSGQRLGVAVYGEPDLSGWYRIEEDGTIDMPLVETIPVGDLSLQQARALIESRLADGYLVHPHVILEVRNDEARNGP